MPRYTEFLSTQEQDSTILFLTVTGTGSKRGGQGRREMFNSTEKRKNPRLASFNTPLECGDPYTLNIELETHLNTGSMNTFEPLSG
jgi:hypothetical protein